MGIARRIKAVCSVGLFVVLGAWLPGCTMQARWLYVRGTRLDLAGDFDGAAACYRKALQENQEFVPARFQLANYYFLKGYYTQAAREYEEILKLEPENEKAKKALALCRIHLLESLVP